MRGGGRDEGYGPTNYESSASEIEAEYARSDEADRVRNEARSAFNSLKTKLNSTGAKGRSAGQPCTKSIFGNDNCISGTKCEVIYKNGREQSECVTK